eukprot:9470507-Pyramimonas_sp.AAC.1
MIDTSRPFCCLDTAERVLLTWRLTWHCFRHSYQLARVLEQNVEAVSVSYVTRGAEAVVRVRVEQGAQAVHPRKVINSTCKD